MEAILLAGGLGSRLHEVTGDRYPKSLAKVGGVPFIHYIVNYLAGMGVSRFVFAVSHHAQLVIDDVTQAFPELDIHFSIEKEPLGTGGAIKQALEFVESENALIVNSDSFIEFSLNKFWSFTEENNAELSIVCTEVDDIARFGAAEIKDHKLVGFSEKGGLGSGYINAGVYLINKKHSLISQQSGKFSFEQDILANDAADVFVYSTRGLFFDIGTPDDFDGAQKLVALHQKLFCK